MKKLAFVPFLAVLFSFTDWHYDLKEAEQIARNGHRYILLNFSGSDWCGPCVRMHKEIFESDVFSKFADTALVMLNADFPRMKKNQLSQKQQAINDELAGKYNANGSFPLTVLLDAEGKVVKEWDGFPKGTPGDFVFDVKSAMNNDGN